MNIFYEESQTNATAAYIIADTCIKQEDTYKPWWQLDLLQTYDVMGFSFTQEGGHYLFVQSMVT